MARYDADYFTKDCFAEKFEYLLDKRYYKIAKHKRRGKFETDYSEYYQDDIHSSVSQWFSRRQRPSIEKLMNICELLDCDIDYFLTEQKIFKKDIMHASKTTGLQYDTVDIISNFSPEQKQILDLFTLLHKPTNLGELLKDFYAYSQSSLQHGTIIDDAVEDTEKKERSIHANELLAIKRFDISSKINNMLEFLRALYWNKILKQGVEIRKNQDRINMEYFANVLRKNGFNDKDIEKRVSEVSANSGYDEIYNELKI